MDRTRIGPNDRPPQRPAVRLSGPVRPAGPAAPSPSALLAVQQGAGNRAALELLTLQRDEDEIPVKAVDKSKLQITTSNIDDAIKIVWKTYQILVRKRRDAVDALRVKAEEDAPASPNVVVDLLLTMVAAGLLGPTGMIGTTIAGKLIKLGDKPALRAKVANEALSNTLNTGIQEGVKKTVAALLADGDKASKKARELFFLTQRTVLSDESDKIEIHFLNNADDYRKMEGEEKGSGVAALKALQDALLETVDSAAKIQEQASIDAWMVYMAQKKLQLSDKKPWFGEEVGTDIGKIMGKGTWGKPTETDGVLVLMIDTPSDDPKIPLKASRAELRGTNTYMRKKLETRPIESLAIPVIAWCVSGGTYHAFSIGRHEGGVTFLSFDGNPYVKNTLLKLKFRAWPHLAGIKEEWNEDEAKLRATSDSAAQAIYNREIAPRAVKDLGATLKASIFG